MGGGDDDSASDTTEITDSIEETTDDTTTEETTTDDETTDGTDTGVDGLVSEDCEELANASSALGEILSGASTGDEIDEASDRFRAFAEQVPEDIRDDVLVLADVYETYAEAFADLDLEEGETPSADQIQELTALVADIDQQAVAEASTNLTTWVTENC